MARARSTFLLAAMAPCMTRSYRTCARKPHAKPRRGRTY
jgi:hypothetical protein